MAKYITKLTCGRSYDSGEKYEKRQKWAILVVFHVSRRSHNLMHKSASTSKFEVLVDLYMKLWLRRYYMTLNQYLVQVIH